MKYLAVALLLLAVLPGCTAVGGPIEPTPPAFVDHGDWCGPAWVTDESEERVEL